MEATSNMTSIFEQIRQTLENPAMRHAAMVHAPVALAMVGIPVLLIALLVPRHRTPRLVGAVWYAVLAATAFLAMQSGEQAEGQLPADLEAAAVELVDRHESLASMVWWIAVGVTLLVGISCINRRPVRIIASILAFAGAVACAGVVATAAHDGGQLVYAHGIGTTPRAELSRVRSERDDLERRLAEATALLEAAAARPERNLGRSEGEEAGGGEAEGSGGPGPSDPSGAVDIRVAFFHESVEPLLASYCQSCHNSRRPKSGLDLTSAAGMAKGGRVLKVSPVVPGDPEQSPLMAIIRGVHGDVDEMPPDDRMAPEEIRVFEQWIKDGAVWGSSS